MPKKCALFEQRLEAAARRRDRAAEQAHFERSFRRSAKGNLWRKYEGKLLTIFSRNDGDYGWCISVDGDPPKFSPGGYETEDEAMRALWFEVT
jgi:hypothetical protein